MQLVITEKPSVAISFARILGSTQRRNGYLEGNGFLVSWCVGHLVELAEPGSYDERYNKWKQEDLPIIPQEWSYRILPSTRKQFDILKSLIHRNDVDSIYNCCDAGREGEAICRLVCEMCGNRKPMKRLWLSSMEDEAIQGRLCQP